MPRRTIAGVLISDFATQGMAVQAVFNAHGCLIKTRLGIHDTGPGACGSSGLVLLELVGDPAQIDRFFDALGAVPGIRVQRMVFGD